jgi:hypothetical protein
MLQGFSVKSPLTTIANRRTEFEDMLLCRQAYATIRPHRSRSFCYITADPTPSDGWWPPYLEISIPTTTAFPPSDKAFFTKGGFMHVGFPHHLPVKSNRCLPCDSNCGMIISSTTSVKEDTKHAASAEIFIFIGFVLPSFRFVFVIHWSEISNHNLTFKKFSFLQE